MIGVVFMHILAIVAIFAGFFLAEETEVMLGFFVFGNTLAIIARLEMLERDIKVGEK